MSGLLATSLSGLMAAQRSLETVQHNISNVNTEGYSRQSVEQASKPAHLTGEGYIGQGVDVTNVARSYDQFVTKQLNSSLSAFGDVDQYQQLSTRIDNLMADPSTGIAPVIDSFFNAVNEVANDPTSIPSRQVLLSNANSLTQSLNTMNSQFEAIRTQNNNDMGAKVNDINSLAKSIADLNVQIAGGLGKAQGLKQPNDLLDKQDALLSKLAAIVNISVAHQADGSSSVFIGSGQALVQNGGASEFTTFQSTSDPGKQGIGINTSIGTMDITSQISGGSLGGALRFRDEVLDPAQQQLGRVAAGMAMDINALHKSGYDLNGKPGVDLFSGIASVPVFQNSQNTGNGVVTANFQDVNIHPSAAANLDYSDFRLKYAGGTSYTLTRIRDNQVINLTASPDASKPNVFNLSPSSLNDVLPGIDISVDLNGKFMSVGDESLIRPTYTAAQTIGVNITDPSKIAAATNVEVDPVTKLPVQKRDASNNLVFNSAGEPVYVIIKGPMPSDNRNALKMASLQNNLGMIGGKASFSDTYGQIVSDVGTLTQAAQSSSSAQQTLLNQAKGAREGLAGVNLDEEAANLIRFQQAYQASAQSIAIAKSLFDSLIGAVR
jgi:flagellar hook-associated protein 1 FlgK